MRRKMADALCSCLLERLGHANAQRLADIFSKKGNPYKSRSFVKGEGARLPNSCLENHLLNSEPARFSFKSVQNPFSNFLTAGFGHHVHAFDLCSEATQTPYCPAPDRPAIYVSNEESSPTLLDFISIESKVQELPLQDKAIPAPCLAQELTTLPQKN